MKKTLIKLLSIIGIIAVIPVSVIVTTSCLDSVYDNTFYAGLKIKNKVLRETEGNKIVVIGGSNVAFSIDTNEMAMYSEYLNEYTVVNYGLYANLGTKIMLDFAKPYIKKDDVVVIQPEQYAQSLSMYFNGEAAWSVIDQEKDLKKLIASENKMDLYYAYPSYAATKFKYNVDGIPNPEGVYSASSFDEYGNISYERIKNEMLVGYDESTTIAFSGAEITQDFIDYLNDYADYCKEIGAKVVYSFSPMNKLALAVDEYEQPFEEYVEYLKTKFTFDILDGYQSAVMDAKWFYDTNFHLNTAGSQYFSRSLVSRLAPLFDNSIRMNYDDIIEPEFNIVTGDTKICDDFVYTTMTSSGKTVASINSLDPTKTYSGDIVIPETLDGYEVARIGNDAFKDQNDITSIDLPSTLRQLGKRCFNSMNSIEKLIIRVVSPNLLTGMPQHYFEQCPSDLKFYVPDDALDTYRGDYNWGEYASRIFGISSLE